MEDAGSEDYPDTEFHDLNVSCWAVRRNGSLGYSDDSHFDTLQTIVRTYVTSILCIFGILGNIVNLIVLTRVPFYKVVSSNERGANIGLIALALSDIFLCVSVLPSCFIDPALAVFRVRSFALYYQAYGTGLVTTFILTSTWITLTLAVMRYIVICRPFSRLAFHSRRLMHAVYCSVCLLAVLINAPTFMHFQIEEIGFVENKTLYYIDIGLMDGKSQFSQAFQWVRFSVFIAMPAVILMFCNCSLVRALHTSQQLRQTCVVNNKEPIKSQNRLTVLLIIIALGFILVFPSELLDFIMDYGDLEASKTELILTIRMFTNTLQMINFSCNFLLYCGLNVHFRAVAVDVFMCFSPSKYSFSVKTGSEQMEMGKLSPSTIQMQMQV